MKYQNNFLIFNVDFGHFRITYESRYPFSFARVMDADFRRQFEFGEKLLCRFACDIRAHPIMDSMPPRTLFTTANLERSLFLDELPAKAGIHLVLQE
ncbi:protein of unknown function [Legionella fallonii LLAP-10]|uniref:Uncharacterized protein n=1 Tax=Legionella fallonii LLAP-10 TaxID=1212491 RepID=A0A098G370_9GAMM|nr:protein of unknown function [Legionella fallonii LLAP-10]